VKERGQFLEVRKIKMSEEILFESSKLVAVSSLKHYDKNPRRGNVKAIAESLQANKQYRPIVVQKSTNKILAGNHTFRAAKELGWEKIAIVHVDVSDEEAKKIVLADNRTSDLAEYDNEVLLELLETIEAPDFGTGYSASDLDLLSSISENAAAEAGELGGLAVEDALVAVQGTMAVESEGSGFEDEEGDEFENAQATLEGVLQLNDDVYFEMGENDFDIPNLREDMLVEEMPDSLITWGGKEAMADDGTSTYLWQYGLASPTSMPYDRTIVCFFTYDFRFEGWWRRTSYYTAKCLNKGITMACVPDFSIMYDDPKIYQYYGMYRGQWVGRFLQEAGIRVIPRVTIHSDDEMLQATWLGIPKNAPVIAGSFQNIDLSDKDNLTNCYESLMKNAEYLEPENYIVYGGKTAKELCEKAQPNLPKTKLTYVENYAGVRRGVVFGKVDGLEAERKRRKASNRRVREDAQRDKMSKPGGLAGRG
jgi:hypothetical protein